MKKVLCIIFVCLDLMIWTGCASNKNLEGNWQTVALIKEDIAQTICVSNIQFVPDGKGFLAKGHAGVNLYSADIKVKGKSFRGSCLINTGFQGKYDAMEFEDMFFTVLTNAEYYKIENDVLYLYAPSKNMEMKFQRK